MPIRIGWQKFQNLPINESRKILLNLLVFFYNARVTHNMNNERRNYYRNVYLKSPHWQRLKVKKFKMQKCCEWPGCGSEIDLDVHHVRYKDLYDVQLWDLMVLCRKHHKEAHKSRVFCDANKYLDMARRFQIKEQNRIANLWINQPKNIRWRIEFSVWFLWQCAKVQKGDCHEARIQKRRNRRRGFDSKDYGLKEARIWREFNTFYYTPIET
jgi:hypothetical protein